MADKIFIFRNFNPKEKNLKIMDEIKNGKTLTAIAKELGVSREYVRQIKEKMLHLQKQNWEVKQTMLKY